MVLTRKHPPIASLMKKKPQAMQHITLHAKPLPSQSGVMQTARNQATACKLLPKTETKQWSLLPTVQVTTKAESRRRDRKTFFALPHKAHDAATNRTFTLECKLGEGATAEVFQAYDSEGQQFAIKVIPKTRIANSYQKARFFDEIKLHRRLDHPNIVKFHCYFFDAEYAYIVMELCENKTLMHLLREETVLSEHQVHHFLVQILEALRYMHAQDIMHGDLKLCNVMLDKNKNPKIGDFGLATYVCGEKQTGLCGTRHFVAPEVKNKKGYDKSADIWSIGAITYTMLFGRYYDEKRSLWNDGVNVGSAHVTELVFPTHIRISDNTKNFISKTLVFRPEFRCTVEQLLQNPFVNNSQLTPLPNKKSEPSSDRPPHERKSSPIKPKYTYSKRARPIHREQGHSRNDEELYGPKRQKTAVYETVKLSNLRIRPVIVDMTL
ncbi:kinase-like domain-containing protein [Radiomyces spectabilis]|uniref:kinase-like domain-containing protein n=1 Tax=Radiomyces spectabilis TaxID=64574 RepID=UPI00221F03F1|nr:kinase-like domain-containing protein [Radiomyces spectabilis]KAI8376274.1 kinase-like domain-containing protein [Radiomyces spectabilis]